MAQILRFVMNVVQGWNHVQYQGHFVFMEKRLNSKELKRINEQTVVNRFMQTKKSI